MKVTPTQLPEDPEELKLVDANTKINTEPGWTMKTMLPPPAQSR